MSKLSILELARERRSALPDILVTNRILDAPFAAHQLVGRSLVSECVGEVLVYHKVTLIYPDDVRRRGISPREDVALCLRHASERTLLERERLRALKRSRASWVIGARWYAYELAADKTTTAACMDSRTP